MLARLNWQSLVALAIFAAGFVGTLHELPAEFWSKLPPEFYVGLGLLVLGAGAALRTGKILHPTDQAQREAAKAVLSKPPPAPVPPGANDLPPGEAP